MLFFFLTFGHNQLLFILGPSGIMGRFCAHSLICLPTIFWTFISPYTLIMPLGSELYIYTYMTFFLFQRGPLGLSWRGQKIPPPPRVGQTETNLGICTFRYERSKFGIFEPPSCTHRAKVRTPNTRLQSKLVAQKTLTKQIPLFRWQNIDPWVSDQAPKMPDFERPAPKIPTRFFFGRPQIFFVWPKV